MVVDFALTDKEEDEPEEGETAGEEALISEEVSEGSGLSANASKVQELADTLAAEIEADGIAAPEDDGDTDGSDGNDEGDDI